MFRKDWIDADPASEVLPAAFGGADFPVCGVSKPGRAVVRQEARIKTIIMQTRRILERFRFMSLLGKGLLYNARLACEALVAIRGGVK
jgi:hypothetical protein